MVFESNREDCFLLLFPVLILIHHKQQALDNICWYGYVNYNFLSFHLVWYSFLKVFAALDGAIDYRVWSRKSALQGSIGPHCGRVDWWILAKALWPVAPLGQWSSEVNDSSVKGTVWPSYFKKTIQKTDPSHFNRVTGHRATEPA